MIGRLNRRELLRIGALSVLGSATGSGRALGSPSKSANQAIFIMLQGGASHLDLWDP